MKNSWIYLQPPFKLSILTRSDCVQQLPAISLQRKISEISWITGQIIPGLWVEKYRNLLVADGEYVYPTTKNVKAFLNNTTVGSWEEELCPMSSSLPLRVHKVYIRVSFSDTFLRWLSPFVTNSRHYQQRKLFPFYTLLGSGCVLISYSMLLLIIAWLG